MDGRRIGTGRAGASAALAGLVAFLFAGPALAVQNESGAPPSKNEERFEDRLVPIPTWSKEVQSNGCPLHTAPSPYDPGSHSNLSEIPFWELIEHEADRYSVRAILDPPDKLSQSLEPLDPDMRMLVLLHALQRGLGADGLHTYFYLTSGQNAPAVRDTLHAAGLTREHALFAQAMALFGPVYPVDNDLRAKRFGYATPSRELNDFDRRLLSLSGKFGSRRDWMAIIVAYVNRRPTLWQRIEAVRARLGDMERLEHLTAALLSPLDFWKPYSEIEQRLTGLAEEQRTLLILAAFNDQFENGGVHQFFYNSEGAIAPDVADALAEIGLDRQAELIKRGIAMFTAPYPRDTRRRRETHFHNHDGWTDGDRLSELTDAFYALDGGPQMLHIGGEMQIQGGPGLRYAMLAFAKRHNMLPC